MIANRNLLFILLLLWGCFHGNSCIAVSEKVFKVQKLHLCNGDSLRGYIKQQIVGEDNITFCTEKGDTVIDVVDIEMIMSDIDSEDNINKLEREYTLKNGLSILGRFVGEKPGKEFYVETKEGMDTLDRNDVIEWSLRFSQLNFENIPILDKITEWRDDGFPKTSKRGLIIYQNYQTDNNVLRLMLCDGGFETILVRDIDRLEKEANEKYLNPQAFPLTEDICVVNNKTYRFVSGEFKKQLTRNMYVIPFPGYDVDYKIEVIINMKPDDVEDLYLYYLKPMQTKRKGDKLYFDLGKAITSREVVNYDEYTNLLELDIYIRKHVKDDLTPNLGFVIIDKNKKRYIPFMISSTIQE